MLATGGCARKNGRLRRRTVTSVYCCLTPQLPRITLLASRCPCPLLMLTPVVVDDTAAINIAGSVHALTSRKAGENEASDHKIRGFIKTASPRQ